MEELFVVLFALLAPIIFGAVGFVLFGPIGGVIGVFVGTCFLFVMLTGNN